MPLPSTFLHPEHPYHTGLLFLPCGTGFYTNLPPTEEFKQIFEEEEYGLFIRTYATISYILSTFAYNLNQKIEATKWVACENYGIDQHSAFHEF